MYVSFYNEKGIFIYETSVVKMLFLSYHNMMGYLIPQYIIIDSFSYS